MAATQDKPFGDLSFQEQGGDLGPPSPQDPDGLPRGGVPPVPYMATYSGQYLTNSRAFSTRFDTATQCSRENARLMRWDPVISGCLEVRSTPVSLLTWTLEPADPEDPRQMDAAKRQEDLLRKLPRFVEGHRWLLVEGLFVGRAGLQTRWSWTPRDPDTGKQMIYPSAVTPVAGDKLGFKWDGRVGIAVSASFASGQVEPLDGASFYFLTREERESLIVHRAFSEDSDYFRPQMAGSIAGSGLRGKLFYLWSLKAQVWALAMEYIRLFSLGQLYVFFEHGNAAHRDAIKEHMEAQDGKHILMLPVFRDPTTGQAYENPLHRIDASTASPAFLQSILTGYFDDLIKFNILFNTLTTGIGPTGLGSGVAEAHEGVAEQRIKLDACMLQETYTQDLVLPMYRVNEPGIPPARFVFSIDSPNVQQMLDTARVIVDMGGSIPQEPLLEAGGIPAAKQGDTILTQVQPQSPAAVGATPSNDPMIGQGGQQPLGA